jgi:polysaccharide biosynthesis transport protein
MSRLYEAIRRAAKSGEMTGVAVTDGPPFEAGEDSLTKFVAGEDSSTTLPDVGEDSVRTPAPWIARESDHSPRVIVENSRRPPKSETEPIARALVQVRKRRVPATQHDVRSDVQIRDLIRMLARRWKLIAAVVAASLVAAGTYNSLATPIYEARARLLVDPDSQQIVPFRQGTEDTSRLDYFATQLEVLRSRGLARATLEQLHLLSGDAASQSNQIDRVLGSLIVAPTKPGGDTMGESRVISVTFRSPDPKLAAQIANGLANAYVERNIETRRQGMRDATQWLNDRLSELRGQVTTSEGALQQYREKQDAVSLDDRQNIVVQKLAQLNAAVTTARTERLDKEALYSQLMTIQASGAPLDTFPAIQANSFIQGLKAELASLQRQRGELAEQLGDLHPDMIKVNTAIEAAERRLNGEMAKVVETVKNDYKAAQARDQGLRAALEDQKREVLALNQKSIGYSALQRDAASTHQIFESVLQRVKETDLSGQLQTNNARILDTAEVPRSSFWPRTQLNLILALFGGSFIAVGLVLGLEHLNPRIANSDEIQEAFGLPLLGVAPQVGALKKGPLTVDKLPPEFQEALRGIRTRILLSPIVDAARTLAVTSTSPGEGKTMLSSALATSMAMAGRRVLLVDADMRRPQLHRLFDVPASPGLSDILTGKIEAQEAVRELTTKGLFIVPAGAEVANPSELLQSEPITELIQGFSQLFDLIVLDCPPVMAVADASIIANAASSVLFIVGSGTSRDVARAAIDRLTSVQAQVVGVVLSKAKIDRRSEYHYPYKR